MQAHGQEEMFMCGSVVVVMASQKQAERG